MPKKFISIIISIIICMCMISPVTGSAKVIEPEIVKTEKWATSYEWNNKNYPFLNVEADIYSDGSIYVYCFFSGVNTSDTSSVIKVYGLPVQNKPFYRYFQDTWSDEMNPSSFFPTYYYIVYNQFCDVKNADYTGYGDYARYFYVCTGEKISSLGLTSGDVKPNQYLSFRCDSPNIRVTEKQNNNYLFKMIPTESIKEKSDFSFLGHDITITPELLSGNIIAEPELTDQEKYIKQLEGENARLKASITNNLFGDINGDNLVDVADAQMILNYYVYTLVNSNAEPLEEWISKK